VGSLLQDLRFGLRLLLKNPGFASIAIATLALGIGVNAIVFTVANEILFEQFPFAHADRILYIDCINANAPQKHQELGVSYPDFLDWRSQAHTFQDMAALNGFQVSLSDNQALPQTYRAITMTSNTLRIIGQKPAFGRDFVANDEEPGAAPVVILSYGLWQRRYGGDPAIVGRTIRIDGNSTTVVGVMPVGFQFPFNDDLWTPLVRKPEIQKRANRIPGVIVVGRMADGVELSSVRSEMNTISRRLQQEYPDTNQGISARVQTFPEFFIGPDLQTILQAMMASVGFVLLIACANVANLLLGRGVARSREISIRIALGAERSRILRQLLAESVLLSLIGTIFGWLIALAGLHACVLATAPFNLARWVNFRMDARAFGFLAFLSVATGIFFGLVPAFRLAKVDMQSALKDGGRGSSVGAGDKLLTQSLVVAEIALALVLLVGAGLTIRTFLGVYTARLGVGGNNILTMRVPVSPRKYPRPDQQIALQHQLLTRLQTLPGVENVAIADYLPTGGSTTCPYELEGAAPVPVRPTAFFLVISADYFRVVDAPVLLGRAFTDSDGVSGPPVVIVNQRFAEQVWQNQNPVGKRLRIYDGTAPGDWLLVVGVVPNIVQN
jgi:putative ABC transport system permease protein